MAEAVRAVLDGGRAVQGLALARAQRAKQLQSLKDAKRRARDKSDHCWNEFEIVDMGEETLKIKCLHCELELSAANPLSSMHRHLGNRGCNAEGKKSKVGGGRHSQRRRPEAPRRLCGTRVL